MDLQSREKVRLNSLCETFMKHSKLQVIKRDFQFVFAIAAIVTLVSRIDIAVIFATTIIFIEMHSEKI